MKLFKRLLAVLLIFLLAFPVALAAFAEDEPAEEPNPAMPVITVQPVGGTVKKGEKFTLSVQAHCPNGDKINWLYFHDWEIYDPENEDSRLKWLHVLISNIKAEINGTFHGLRRIDLQSYLTEFEWRFNRRQIPDLMLPKLIDSCFLTPSLRYYAVGECMG